MYRSWKGEGIKNGKGSSKCYKPKTKTIVECKNQGCFVSLMEGKDFIVQKTYFSNLVIYHANIRSRWFGYCTLNKPHIIFVC